MILQRWTPDLGAEAGGEAAGRQAGDRRQLDHRQVAIQPLAHQVEGGVDPALRAAPGGGQGRQQMPGGPGGEEQIVAGDTAFQGAQHRFKTRRHHLAVGQVAQRRGGGQAEPGQPGMDLASGQMDP